MSVETVSKITIYGLKFPSLSNVLYYASVIQASEGC